MEFYLHSKLRYEQNTAILGLKGYLTLHTRDQFQMVRNELSPNSEMLAFDFSELVYMDNYGLKEFIQFIFDLKNQGIKVNAFGMREDIFDILDCMDLNVEMQLFQTKSDFVGSL